MLAPPMTTLKLLYVTPEKLVKSKRFQSKLSAAYKCGHISRFAIDVCEKFG
jgi:ATP-dependent DNA helicase Q1